MAEVVPSGRLDRFMLDRTVLFGFAALIAAEAALVLAYATSPLVEGVTDPLAFGFVLLQPFVWIDVGLLAVLTTRPPSVSVRRRWLGVVVAVGYFLVLAYFGGLLGSGMGAGVAGVNWRLPPGYGPRAFYDGALLSLTLEPYKVVGYGALAYLVYVTLLDAAGAALSGLVGLFSCVSCTWPIVGTIAAGIFGGSSALATVATNQAYPLSTLVFLSAVALLWWRPSFR